MPIISLITLVFTLLVLPFSIQLTSRNTDWRSLANGCDNSHSEGQCDCNWNECFGVSWHCNGSEWYNIQNPICSQSCPAWCGGQAPAPACGGEEYQCDCNAQGSNKCHAGRQYYCGNDCCWKLDEDAPADLCATPTPTLTPAATPTTPVNSCQGKHVGDCCGVNGQCVNMQGYLVCYGCPNNSICQIGQGCVRPTLTPTPTLVPTPTIPQKCFCPHACMPGSGGCWPGSSGPNECSFDCCSQGACPSSLRKNCGNILDGQSFCGQDQSKVTICDNGQLKSVVCAIAWSCRQGENRCLPNPTPTPSFAPTPTTDVSKTIDSTVCDYKTASACALACWTTCTRSGLCYVCPPLLPSSTPTPILSTAGGENPADNIGPLQSISLTGVQKCNAEGDSCCWAHEIGNFETPYCTGQYILCDTQTLKCKDVFIQEYAKTQGEVARQKMLRTGYANSGKWFAEGMDLIMSYSADGLSKIPLIGGILSAVPKALNPRNLGMADLEKREALKALEEGKNWTEATENFDRTARYMLRFNAYGSAISEGSLGQKIGGAVMGGLDAITLGGLGVYWEENLVANINNEGLLSARRVGAAIEGGTSAVLTSVPFINQAVIRLFPQAASFVAKAPLSNALSNNVVQPVIESRIGQLVVKNTPRAVKQVVGSAVSVIKNIFIPNPSSEMVVRGVANDVYKRGIKMGAQWSEMTDEGIRFLIQGAGYSSENYLTAEFVSKVRQQVVGKISTLPSIKMGQVSTVGVVPTKKPSQTVVQRIGNWWDDVTGAPLKRAKTVANDIYYKRGLANLEDDEIRRRLLIKGYPQIGLENGVIEVKAYLKVIEKDDLAGKQLLEKARVEAAKKTKTTSGRQPAEPIPPKVVAKKEYSSQSLGKAGGATHRGARAGNQDYLGMVSRGQKKLYLVTDGVGGEQGGDLASRAAVEAATKAWQEGASLPQAIDAANVAVKGLQYGQFSKAMTTIVAFETNGFSANIGWVGDSRAYLVRSGRAIRLTSDHSYVAEAVARGEMTAYEAEISSLKNIVTRVLGNDNHTPGFNSLSLQAGDAIALVTDGVCGVAGAEQRIAALSQLNITEPGFLGIFNKKRQATAYEKATWLVNQVIQQRLPGQDNTTALIVDFTP